MYSETWFCIIVCTDVLAAKHCNDCMKMCARINWYLQLELVYYGQHKSITDDAMLAQTDCLYRTQSRFVIATRLPWPSDSHHGLHDMEHYHAVSNILNEHVDIDEFDYLLAPYTDADAQTTFVSTITHCNGNIVLVNNIKLGITYEIVPLLYAYAKQQYNDNVDTRDESTRVLLLINSDVNTYYNYRCFTLTQLVQQHASTLTDRLCCDLNNNYLCCTGLCLGQFHGSIFITWN